LQLARRAASQSPDAAAANVLAGISQYHLGHQDKAVDTLQQAARKAPDSFAAQYFCGWVLCETGNYADALQPLRRAYAMRKNNPDLLLLLARAALQKNLKEGATYLQALRAYRDYRTRPEVYNALGVLWFGQGDYQRARENFLLALQYAPDNCVVLQNLAVLYDQYLGAPDRAHSYYIRALKAAQVGGDTARQEKIRERLRQLVRQRSDQAAPASPQRSAIA
jgi:tetratricopeptide (TPR) repeat protein